MSFVPSSWKDTAGWQRTVSQYVNPLIEGKLWPQYETAPSPAQNEGYGYYDLTIHGPAWYDGSGYRYFFSSDVSGNVSVAGTLTVIGATSLSSLSTSANTAIGGTLGVTGATSLSSLSTSGNATVGGTLGVTGTTTVNSFTANGISNVQGVLGSGSFLTSGAVGFRTGAGGTVTQTGSRTSAVTLNTQCGAITLVSAAGSTTFASFTVNNNLVGASDTIRVCQKSGTDRYRIHVSKVANNSFEITFATTTGTTTEQPVFNFAVHKGVTS